ncbi:hypothetical protein ACFOLK_17305 [Marinococcus halophilus]|uniref:hypothetical protein n=1 Tax=Marinococcus halophilus TaxID=1371 RepID=UPI00360EADAF
MRSDWPYSTSAGRGQEWNQCVYAIKHYVEMKMIADEEDASCLILLAAAKLRKTMECDQAARRSDHRNIDP